MSDEDGWILGIVESTSQLKEFTPICYFSGYSSLIASLRPFSKVPAKRDYASFDRQDITVLTD